LEPDEEYEFTVEARDAAGNWSNDGPSKEVTTQESADNDTTKPHWSDGTLNASNITSTRLTLKWLGADDNVEVTKYRIYIDDGLKYTVGADANIKTVAGLDEDTDYSFRVEAGDQAGNWSTDGPEETFSTTD
jgi:large repetitive protein